MMFRSSASEVARELKARSSPACQLWVGTCGYSYVEWAEAGFYPRGTRPAHMLRFYARCFSVTELNHTWYQLPRAEAVERQRQRAHPGFYFSAKLTRTMTHEVDPDGWREQAAAFRAGIAPLLQTGQLLAVLVQLPNAFGHTRANRRHLAQLLDELAGLPLAVEFRNVGWALDRVYAELERRRVSLVTVDEPELPGLFPALDVVTNPELVYVRLHGRNGKAWYSGRKERQFDYDYADDELRRWVDATLEPLARQARRGVILFNNHVAAQAPRNARTLIRLLQRRGFAVTA